VQEHVIVLLVELCYTNHIVVLQKKGL